MVFLRMPKILRITTVPISLNILLKGQLAFMQQNDFEVITASADGPEVEEVVKREGVQHHQIDFTRTLSPLKDLKALFQLITLIRKERPDIVHTHTPKAGLLGMLAAKICGVKLRMHTVAGMPLMEATGNLKRILTFTEGITYFCADHVYPNSYQLKSWLEEHFPKYARKFKLIGKGSSNGISSAHFNPALIEAASLVKLRDQLKIPKEAVCFIFVGRLVSDKGIHELIDAFIGLPFEAHLILVGSYEDDREPVDLETKCLIQVKENIHHVGFQADIRPFLAIADVFVFPSYREGFPNVVLQAAAMGLPSIVSNINGCNEIIREGFNGLIVPVKDEDSLKWAMEKLLDNEDLRVQLASNARASVQENYDQLFVWQALLKEYQSL
jgi:glycosyltransferase involved in cell wall biosynthesis